MKILNRPNEMNVLKLECSELTKDFQKLMQNTVLMTVKDDKILYWKMELVKLKK